MIDKRIVFANRVFTVATFALVFVLIWIALELFSGPAKADSLYVIPVMPTVSGIEAAPSPAPFYRRPVTVHSGPSAGIYWIEPAPPNGCQRPAFEVISGSPAERGCYSRP